MRILEVQENKKLVLKNVVIKQLRDIEAQSLDFEVQKFINQLKVAQAQMFGPIILRMLGTKFQEDGSLSFDYDVIVQAHDFENYKEQFHTEIEHCCNQCIYVRFEGELSDVNYAQMKLDVYLYENELESTGETYTVYVDEDRENAIIDIFRPVTGHETLQEN